MRQSPRYAALAFLALSCASHEAGDAKRPDIVAAPASHAVEVVMPAILQGLPIGVADARGRVATTPCATCHGREDAGVLPQQDKALAGPHVGLVFRHGTLRCAACHEQRARDQLHLADGRTLPLTEAMQLCSQCHGLQKRDYDHGAHGGMRGHWDLSRGPRERNHCVACHDPHAPAFGRFAPVAGPRDRFTETTLRVPDE